jgi:hypothetical protein
MLWSTVNTSSSDKFTHFTDIYSFILLSFRLFYRDKTPWDFRTILQVEYPWELILRCDQIYNTTRMYFKVSCIFLSIGLGLFKKCHNLLNYFGPAGGGGHIITRTVLGLTPDAVFYKIIYILTKQAAWIIFKKTDFFKFNVKYLFLVHIRFKIPKHKQVESFFFFTVVPCILILSKFYHQLMHKRIALKGVIKFTLKQLQHVSV